MLPGEGKSRLSGLASGSEIVLQYRVRGLSLLYVAHPNVDQHSLLTSQLYSASLFLFPAQQSFSCSALSSSLLSIFRALLAVPVQMRRSRLSDRRGHSFLLQG